MNGDNLPHDFWIRLDEKFKGVYDKIDVTNDSINEIKAYGCAKRPDDLKRVENLEGWRDRGIVGIIATLLMSLGALIGMIFGQK